MPKYLNVDNGVYVTSWPSSASMDWARYNVYQLVAYDFNSHSCLVGIFNCKKGNKNCKQNFEKVKCLLLMLSKTSSPCEKEARRFFDKLKMIQVQVYTCKWKK